MSIQWTPAMSTGVPEIDAQHQELFRQINALGDAMLKREGTSKVVQTIDFLLKYTNEDFSAEEAYMDRHQCPVAAVNKRAHDDLKKTLAEKRRMIDQGGVNSALVLELKSLLGNWLTTHIAAVDTRLKPSAAKAAA